ncbi:MAG: phosphatase PAP2 family protein [Planctomycetota bacterium]
MKLNQSEPREANSGGQIAMAAWQPWLAGGLVLAIAAAGVSSLALGARQWIQSLGLRGDLERVIKLMEIFAHGTGLLVTLALIWTLAPDYRLRLPRLLAAYGLAGLTVNLIKVLVPRLRPSAGPEASLPAGWGNWEYLSQSFPSGHSAAAVALALSLALLFPRGRVVFLILATLACLQRIIFDAHWPSDVLAGAAIGVWAVAVVYRTAWADQLFRHIEKSSPV